MTYMCDINGPIQGSHGQKFFDLQLCGDGALHLTIPAPLSCGGDDVLVCHLQDVLAQVVADDADGVIARFDDDPDQPKRLSNLLRLWADKIEKITVRAPITDPDSIVDYNIFMVRLLSKNDRA